MRPVFLFFSYFEDLLSFEEDLLSSDLTLELFEVEDLEDGHLHAMIFLLYKKLI